MCVHWPVHLPPLHPKSRFLSQLLPSTSPDNFRMVVVNRKDKEGVVIEDDPRVCINVAPNPHFEDFSYNPPRIRHDSGQTLKIKVFLRARCREGLQPAGA